MKINQEFLTTNHYKNLSNNNYKILREIIKKMEMILNGKREIMYSDIINLIIREGYIGESYNDIILWCNYKIRLGEIYVEL
ncbi:MAG: hypothetical protein ACXABO_06965 [Promethearchaeota archaeon]|jgi:hypothetical protein